MDLHSLSKCIWYFVRNIHTPRQIEIVPSVQQQRATTTTAATIRQRNSKKIEFNNNRIKLQSG